MSAAFEHGNVKANCPGCNGAITTFEFRSSSSGEHGGVIVEGSHDYKGGKYKRIVYKLLKCAGCGMGGLAKLHAGDNYLFADLESFHPVSVDTAKLPKDVPDGIQSEIREAELCAAHGAWRGASGLLRSALEKLLKANGYAGKSSLADRIDQASADGVITEARRKRAHDDVRVLGNDVLHDEWREVKPEEVEAAHHYVQRIAEDFYDDRPIVEALLKAKGRIPK